MQIKNGIISYHLNVFVYLFSLQLPIHFIHLHAQCLTRDQLSDQLS